MNMERAILVITHLKKDKSAWETEEAARELIELTHSSGGEVLGEVKAGIDYPSPAYFVGRGKVEEIAQMAKVNQAEVVIFNDNLSATQQRNLEEIITVKTIDRTQLILDIFAQHARTTEGKFQVELAQLEYLLPRLSGKGVMLSRLGGGIGTRGPGEQKLEVDRRRIRKRIARLSDDLRKIHQRRQALRKRRKEIALATVAFIGYTNAGKTSLLNALTSSQELVRDSLFSTLDSLARRYVLPDRQKVILTDTVGFLHRLPHNLIEAFKATLEEVVEADILVHVLDISDTLVQKKNDAVYTVLAELQARDKPIITALNKIDKIEPRGLIERQMSRYGNAVAISALKQVGLEELIHKITVLLGKRTTAIHIFIPQDKIKLLYLIYNEGRVIKKTYRAGGVYIEAVVPVVVEERLKAELRHHSV
jgi:GTP-binding protein HflX